MENKNDIRFLVTSKCNYDCYFCHAEGVHNVSRKHELSVANYVTLFKMHSELEGWNGVTLSGGEPFVYRQIDTLIESLSEEGANITVVTNGSLIQHHLSVFKHIKRINVSINTLDEAMYAKITGKRPEQLQVIKNNLQLVRNFYLNLEIRLNVTPCKSNGWSINELEQLISYAKQINASIKCTELFPNNDDNCVKIETLKEQLTDLGYVQIPFEGRTDCYENNGHQVFLTQCTCSRAILSESPIEYCRNNHDLYVNHDATFPMCRLSSFFIDFWEEIDEDDMEFLKLKMLLAKKKISKDICLKKIRSIYC